MMKRPSILHRLTAALFLPCGFLSAADQSHIYGSQIMTEQERNEFQERVRSARTDQERQQIRNEHHQKMQLRAKEQGLTLPAKPPAKGAGRGQGHGGKGKQ